MLRCVCSAARDGGGEGRGHIVSPRAQLVKFSVQLPGDVFMVQLRQGEVGRGGCVL